MNKFILFLLFFVTGSFLKAQTIKSPEEFLGYKAGEMFTYHHRVVDYFKYVAAEAKNVKLIEYGKTNEGRPLMVAVVASPENFGKLDEIRQNNLKLAGIQSGKGTTETPVILWLSYNVHGNEASSTEVSMQTLYSLVNPAESRTKNWLSNMVVIIDPCLNPDGRDRYANFFNPIHTAVPDVNPAAREHQEPWPGGRANHYYFDLNRDWAWQTQVETQARIALYNQWLPQVHVDYHEQGYNEPYYFAPAAEPFHQDITPWQRSFQTIIGKNNAKYFDENGWMYFTKERFDLLYPSYGDTYPTYNGSIGMTYEQGGIRAGLGIITDDGDTLTLKDRINHHFTTSLATMETVSANAKKAVTEFAAFFNKAVQNPPGEYKTYVIKNTNEQKMKTLTSLLSRNGIQYGFGAQGGGNGFNYFSGKNEKFNIDNHDLVISAYQPKSVLLKVLFEPRTFIADSNTYDITAWALPYAYGLNAYATKEKLQASNSKMPLKADKSANATAKPYAWVTEWNALSNAQFLADVLKQGIKVRFSETDFENGTNKFKAGSLIITRTSNSLNTKLEEKISAAAAKADVKVYPVYSGFSEKGADFGSPKVRMIKAPKIGLLGGDRISSLAYGEIWHFFEKQLNYPVTQINTQYLNRINLNDFTVIIAPDGSYESLDGDAMQNWIKAGGKLIALEGAVAQLADKKGFALKTFEEKKDDKDLKKTPYASIKKYEEQERNYLEQSIPGAIYKVNLDNSHPLAFGFPDYYYTLKQDANIYQFMENGWNVGVLKKDNYVTGFAGAKTKSKLKDGLLFGSQQMGNGAIVYLADNPLFRSFWENGKLLFSNAVFMVD